ncbi:MAG: ATP-binding protein [Uliginosibacterium sp.]|nr:ATP-binding protein [Uliginosibacterium sp.]
MAEIVLCCGKVSSGKSTFARRLAAERGHFPFSADEWMRHFYGEPPEREVFDRQLGQCCEMIYRMAERLLARGVDVVLDFGFWQRAERIAVRQRFEAGGHRCRVVYFPIEAHRQWAYLQARQADPAVDHYAISAETLAVLNAMFEPPEPDEKVETVDAL